MRFDGKAALVTGGSEGIGAAIVRRLASQGASVTLDYHTHSQDANAIAQELQAKGCKVQVVQADVGNVGSIQHLVQQAVAAFGRIDILVNNAGIEMPTPFTQVTEQQWDAQIAVDLKGAYFAAQEAARQMIARGISGVIVNVSSVHEDLPMVGNSVYSSAKGGLRMMTRTLAPELAQQQIRIVNVGPGAIATSINAATLANPTLKAELLKEIPLGRIGTPADIAEAVCWLASEEASYITGTTLFVDGGLMVNAGGL
ncbi:MAG TPA: glucose 1-dehydrogenase [Ktedonobacterales bacterium]